MNPTGWCGDFCFRKILGNFAGFHGNAYRYFVFLRLSEATQNGACSRKFEIAKNRLAIGAKKSILQSEIGVCPVRLEVRTSGFHPENRSSILLRDARSWFLEKPQQGACFVGSFLATVCCIRVFWMQVFCSLCSVGFFCMEVWIYMEVMRIFKNKTLAVCVGLLFAGVTVG